ncbi:MAG TPA: NAD-dependent epimerase/dehydratase family protein [Thermomicrobiales bacterium]|nr:NAD-dependent epimerase/dehydratase family protein [Thermomicrobiales bacterium]
MTDLAIRPWVLLTGAAGRIGTAFRQEAGTRYHFRLTDLQVDGLADTPGEGHQVVRLDVADLDACRDACAGMDAVVHLAADPNPAADFAASLLANNIVGARNVFLAALEAECRRVVFASSIQTVLAYPPDAPIPVDVTTRPENLYGASKCWGEAAASAYAARGLSVICVRIGAYDAPWLAAPDVDPMELAAYVSKRDLNQLLSRAIDADDIGYAIVYGVSDNHPNRVDLTSTRALLGYAPVDDGFRRAGPANPGDRTGA